LGVAIAGVTSVFSIGMSMYNTYEITQLKQDMATSRQERDQIIEIISKENTAIEALTTSLSSVNSSIRIIGEEILQIENGIRFLSQFAGVHTGVETYTSELGLFVNGLFTLLNGRLHPNLVDMSKLGKLYDNLNNQARAKNLQLLFKDPSSIFQCDISYVVTENVIDIYVHVPMVEASLLTLYKYLNIPVHNDKSPGDPVIFFENWEHLDILAISESSRNGLEMSQQFLNQCKKQENHIGFIYLCNQNNLIKKDISNTCLGTLFGGTYEQKSLEKKCETYVDDVQEAAYQISNNQFIFFSKKETKLTYKCTSSNKDFLRNEMVMGLKEITLNDSCHAYSNEYIFFPQFNLKIDSPFLYLPRTLDFENTAFDFSNLKELYETMAKIHLPQKINMRELMSITKSRTYQNWHSYLILTAILLVVGIVFYLGYTYIKFNCKKNPFRRIKKPEDNQENIPLE
jgi:hypothetical protein